MSPFGQLFQEDDWAGFEYLRDVKYFYCEGYGRDNVHLLAVPFLEAAISSLSTNIPAGQFPLKIGFTHREGLLYLCCLLGISYRKGWIPPLSQVEHDRGWRVADLAPYLGHIGIESYGREAGEGVHIRIIVSGEVRPAFRGRLETDDEGGYHMGAVRM